MRLRGFRYERGILALSVVAGLLAVAPSAIAKTFAPNKRSDHTPNGCSKSDCTLREAVIAANNRPGSDKIVLEAGKTYKLSLANAPGPSEEAAATGDLDINGGSLKIQSSDKKKLAKVNAQGIERVFDVSPMSPASATFKLLRITGGNTSSLPAGLDAGGGVLVQGGSLSVKLSSVSGNFTKDDGGGIAGVGASSIAIKESSISGNASADRGGGLEFEGVSATVTASTVSDNIARSGGGGGIRMFDGTLSVVNSTLANNSTPGDGGSIRAGGNPGSAVSLASVTVVRNHANTDSSGTGVGGGLAISGPLPFTVRNSIVALNTVGTPGSGPDCGQLAGSYTSAGVNLFTDLSGCSGFSAPPNILTSSPKLGSLKNNGGPTKTIELKKHSPAINNAGSGSPKRDQRGEKRKKPDIGAFERT
jgi:hypothetical protein